MFTDRVPTYPNRYKLTPEGGGDAIYVTLERADEPTVEGTHLNAATLNALLPKPLMGATVGQYLRVSAVDANGMVTAVEAVNPNEIVNATV